MTYTSCKDPFINNRHTGASYTVFLKVTVSVLAGLFKTTESTIRRWIRLGKLNPESLLDIIEKYNNRFLLDARRSAK